MKSSLLFVVCVGIIFAVREISAQVVTNWTSFLIGYYNENPSDREFGINPGLYNYSSRNGNQCRYSCKANLANFGYAGVGASGSCFCSSTYGRYAVAPSSTSNTCTATTISTPCTGNTTQAVYQTPSLIRGLSMVVNSTTDSGAMGRLFSNLSVWASFQSGNASYYSVDLGDGMQIGTIASSITYWYVQAPATMEVVLNVTDLEGNSQLFSTVVEVKLGLHSPNLTCPMYVAPSTSFTCQLSAYGGQLMGDINFGDGNRSLVYVGGSSTYFVGTSVARSAALNSTSNRLHIMIRKSFQYKGMLRGWRFSACGTGNVRFLVFRPYCTAPLQFCYQSRSCLPQSECAGSAPASANTCNSFMLANRNCYNFSSNTTSQALSWQAPPFNQLAIIGETNYTIVQLGEQELKLNLDAAISVLPGDVIGLDTSGMGSICAETADYQGQAVLNTPADWSSRYSSGYTLLLSAVTTANNPVDHRIAAYVERPAAASITHSYAETYQKIAGPGKSLVMNGSVWSATQNFSVSYSTVVVVQSVIMNVTVQGDSYAATNSSYLFEAITYPLCNASCAWLVDGVNVSPLGRCSLNFTFVQPGVRVVEVLTQNQVSQKNASFTVTVEDRVMNLSFTTNTSVTEHMSKSYVFASIVQGTSPFCTFTFRDGPMVKNATFSARGLIDPSDFFVEFLGNQSVVATYTFENAGNWSASLNICNHVSCQSAAVYIHVVRRITSVSIENPPVLVYGRDLLLGFAVGNGSDVSVLFSVDGYILWNVTIGSYQAAVSSGNTYTGSAMIRFRDYITSGSHLLCLNATNALGYETTFVTLWVELFIEHTSLRSNVSAAEPMDVIEFEAAVFNASRVYVRIDYGDGANDAVYRDYLDLLNNSMTFSHTYLGPGNYTAVLEAHNNISTLSSSTTVIIQNAVTGAYSINSNTPIAIEDASSFGNAIVSLNLTSLGMNRRPTDVHATYYFLTPTTNSSVYHYVGDNADTAFYSYSSYGNYTVIANVSNLISSEVLRAVLVAEQRIRDLTIESSHEFVAYNESLILNVSMSWGSRVSLIWDYDDGSPTTTAYYSSRNSVEHICGVIGVFRPSVTAVNALGSTTAYTQRSYAVQHVVSGFTLEAVNKTPSIGAPHWTTISTFVLRLNCSTPLATNASYEVDYGDGSISTRQELSPVITSSECSVNGAMSQLLLNITHAYNLSKTYLVNINISNSVSKQMYSTSFHLYENIFRLCVAISPSSNVTDLSSTTACFAQSGVVNYFATDATVYAHAVLDRGSDLKYCWSFTEPPSCNMTSNAFSSTSYADAGSYRVTVIASNLNDEVTASHQIVVQKPVSGIQISSQPVGPINTIILFQVNAGNNGTDACYHIDFGNAVVMLGDIKQCNESYESDLVSGKGQFSQEYTESFLLAVETSSSFIVSYVFANAGAYTIQLTGVNKVSSVRSTARILLTPKPCYIPVVNISSVNPCVTLDGASCDTSTKYANQIKIHFASEPLYVNSLVVVNCTELATATFKWQMFLVNTSDGEEVEQNASVVAIPGQRLRQLSFGARQLTPGLYRFALNVTMSCNAELTAKDSVYIRIVSTPLVAAIRGGAFRRIGIGNYVLLDAQSGSTDPDVEPGQQEDLECIWLCRRACEVFPVYDSSYTRLIKQFNSTCDSSEPVGCFADEHLPPGRFSPSMSFDRGNCVINQTFGINQTGQKIVIMVVVVKGTRTSSAVQINEFVLGRPPLLEITCLSNCYGRINPLAKIGYKVAIENNRFTPQYSCRWELSRSDGYNSSLVVLPTNYTSEYFIMNPKDVEAISPSSSAGITFTLTVFVSDASRFDQSTAGATYVQFSVGAPPLVGDCSVINAEGTNSSGVALSTFFNIRCRTPFKAAGKGPLTYTISFSPDFTVYSILGASQSTHQVSGDMGTLLPAGLPKNNYTVSIILLCYDEIGSWTELAMTAQVRPATNEIVDNCVLNVQALQGPVANFNASGDTASMLNYLGALLLTLSDHSRGWNVSAVNITCTNTVESSQSLKVTYNDSILTDLIEQCINKAHLDYEAHLNATEVGVREKAITIVAAMPIDNIRVATQVLSFLAVPAEVSSEQSVPTLHDAVALVQECVDVYKRTADESALLDSSVVEMGNLTVDVLDGILQASSSALEATPTRENATQLYAVQVKAVLLLDIVATFVATTVIPGDAPLILQSTNLSVVIGKSLVADDRVTLRASEASIDVQNVSSLFPDPQSVVLMSAYVHEVNPFHDSSSPNISDPVNSKVLQFMLRGENGEKMNTTGNLTMSSEFYLRRDSSRIPSALVSGVAARADDPSAQLEVHKIFVRPGMSLQLSLNLNTSAGAQNGSAARTAQLAQSTLPAEATTAAAVVSTSRVDAATLGTWRVYIKKESAPTVNNYDDICELPVMSSGPRSEASQRPSGSCMITGNAGAEGATYYIAVAYSPNNDLNSTHQTGATRRKRSADSMNSTTDLGASPGYGASMQSAQCSFWDYSSSAYTSNGCEVGAMSVPTSTQCICNRLPFSKPNISSDGELQVAATQPPVTLASLFEVPINAIDFSKLTFNNLDDNPLVFSVMLAIVCMYLCSLVWARKQDKLDEAKAVSSPLLDNDPRDRYLYELTIYTGGRSRAGTTAKVSMILSGEEDETPPRLIYDDKRPVLQRGSIDSFIMAVPRPLGSLTMLRVWHDNSGRSPSWYFSRMLVCNMQTQEKYYFVADHWLAVDEEDSAIDRIVPVAGKTELTNFNHLFWVKSKKDLLDGHIWFSVFGRPAMSRFTRVQRLTCCLSLLFSTMAINILFYGASSNSTTTSEELFEFGPVKITRRHLLTGVYSSFLVFPVNLIVVMIFRKSAVRRSKALRTVSGEAAQSTISSLGRSGYFDGDRHLPVRTAKKRKIYLPWWCIFLAYLLCLGTVVFGILLTTDIALGFGPERSAGWLISFITSFFESLLFTQPLKVLGMALFFALVIKKPAAEADTGDRHLGLRDDEVYYQTSQTAQEHSQAAALAGLDRYKDIPQPPSPEYIKAAQNLRKKHLAMQEIIRDIVTYLLFLFALLLVCYGSNSPATFLQQQNLRAAFRDGYYSDRLYQQTFGQAKVSMSKVATVVDFWAWIYITLLPGIYAGQYVTNPILPFFKDVNYHKVNGQLYASMASQCFNLTVDGNAVLVGAPRLRQLRVRPQDPCRKVDLKLSQPSCLVEYSELGEDKGFYLSTWLPRPTNSTVPQGPDPWTYSTSQQLDGLPTVGHQAIYGGGGYVAELSTDLTRSMDVISDLMAKEWIDNRTRAVIIEFSLFNANLNLNAAMTLLFEVLPTGGILPFFSVYVFTLDRYTGAGMFTIVVTVAEIATSLFAIYFIIREIKTAIRDKSRYFKNPWNLYELLVVGTCFGAIVVYINRLVVGRSVMAAYRADKTRYLNIGKAVMWDEAFVYMVAVIVFASTLKMTKMLRFNQRIMMFIRTLAALGMPLLSFFGVMLTAFAAFISAAYVLFSTHLQTFTTLWGTCETLFVMMLNKFNFSSIINTSPVLGPMFFLVFTVFINFMMVNFMMTLIMSKFSEIKDEAVRARNYYELVDFMISKMKAFLGMASGPSLPRPHSEASGFVSDDDGPERAFDNLIGRIMSEISSDKEHQEFLAAADNETRGSASDDPLTLMSRKRLYLA